MSTSTSGTRSSARDAIASVECTATRLTAMLSDGREISAPVSWYPRLADASSAERENWKLIGGGYGIHWPDIDEDISLRMLLDGMPSIEAARIAP